MSIIQAKQVLSHILPRLDITSDAVCRQTDPEIFFPEKGSPAAAAIKTCMACTIRRECLLIAIVEHEPYGIWGGMTKRERRVFARNEVDFKLLVAELRTEYAVEAMIPAPRPRPEPEIQPVASVAVVKTRVTIMPEQQCGGAPHEAETLTEVQVPDPRPESAKLPPAGVLAEDGAAALMSATVSVGISAKAAIVSPRPARLKKQSQFKPPRRYGPQAERNFRHLSRIAPTQRSRSFWAAKALEVAYGPMALENFRHLARIAPTRRPVHSGRPSWPESSKYRIRHYNLPPSGGFFLPV